MRRSLLFLLLITLPLTAGTALGEPRLDRDCSETLIKLQEEMTLLRAELNLLRAQAPRPFWLVPLGEIQQEVIENCPDELRVLLYRRFMLRLAERIARREGAKALVTGESLGQVASQTIENMSAVESGVSVPVLRPLIGFDKREIIEAARRLGTFQIRGAGQDDCCSYLLPARPATKARREELEAAEAGLPAGDLIEEAFRRAERIRLAEASPPSAPSPHDSDAER